MTGVRYVQPFAFAFSLSGAPIPNAELHFYLTQSSTEADTYADVAMTIPNSNPVLANASGIFPNIFLNPTITYKAVLSYPEKNGIPGAIIWTADPLDANGISAVLQTIEIIATDGQTVFETQFEYVVGYVSVHVNGSLLSQTEFTATNGTTVTILEPLQEGDVVVIESFLGSQVTPTAESLAFIQAGVGALARNAQGKMRERITPVDFGAVADGVTDDTVPIQEAINQAQTLGSPVYFGGLDYAVAGDLYVDLNKTSLFGEGALLLFTDTAPSLGRIRIDNSHPDANYRGVLSGARMIEGFVFRGPGAVHPVLGMLFNKAPASPSLSNNTVRNCSFLDFRADVEFLVGAFCCKFENCTFTQLLGYSSDYSIKGTGNSVPDNAGERQTFIDCFWYNRDLLLYPGTQTFMLVACSLDYAKRAITINSSGAVFLSQCHIEFTNGTDYWASVDGNTVGLLSIRDSLLVFAGEATAFSPLYVGDLVELGGIILDGVYTANNSVAPFTVPLVAGGGRLRVNDITQSYSHHLAIGKGANLLANGSFDDPAITFAIDGWTLVGAVTRDTTSPHSGTACAKITGDGAFSRSFPCKPGQMGIGEFWYKTALLGGVAIGYATMTYMAGDGVTALSGEEALNTTADVGVWTRVSLPSNINQKPAPKGTASVRLSFNILSDPSGLAELYIDDIMITPT